MKVRTMAFLCALVLGWAIGADELPAAQQRQFEYEQKLRLAMLELNPALKYEPGPPVDACTTNSDFEQDISTRVDWVGGYGSVNPTNKLPIGDGEPDFDNFELGILSGDVNSKDARQTSVSDVKDDSLVGIKTVAPTGSTKAVRIGNAMDDYGAELLSKTFIVQASKPIIDFWYAVVLEDPGHLPHEQPTFSVRVLDANGNPIQGRVDLVNQRDKLIAGELFFVKKPGTMYVYRDWDCAQIDLRGYEGQKVTVQFVTEDCSQGAHFGYAYIDDFCGDCEGAGAFVALDEATSSTCGRGQLCYDYALPTIGTTTGSAVITLTITQNGNTLRTMASPSLNSGNRYCFSIDPSTIPGLSPGSFVATASGAFTITHNGQTANFQRFADPIAYQVVCDSAGCCPTPNLITNGGFESGNTGFTSDFTYIATGAVMPGQYAVVDSTQASAIASSWNVQNHGSCSASGKVLVVNGATGTTGSRKVWSQTVPVTPLREYRFCANFRNLPQCNLDVNPDVEVRFSVPSTITSSSINTNAANGCDWQAETRSVFVPANVTSLTVEIWLDESAAGDGNDLAIDDLSLHEMVKASPGAVLVNIASSNLTTTTYNITATPAPQTLSYYWEVCEVDSAGNCLTGTQVQNPSAWWIPGANDFKGYVGSGVLGPLTTPGIFQVGKKYKIVYGVFDPCTSFTASTWYFSFNINTGRVEVERAFR